jgi:hypothetical protein
MTTSGSLDFALVTNSLIEEAFDLCGIGSEGEEISADQYARALRSLNLLVKAWSTQEHLWLRTSKTVTLLASTASYALTPKPMRIIEARRKVTSGGVETPLTMWARQQYSEQPNKTADSIPTAFYYDPQLTTGTLYLWPRPSAATAAAMTVELTYLRRIEDFDGSADDPDLPQEWLMALTYGLAAELVLKYNVRPDIAGAIRERAAILKMALDSFDTEPASLFMQPEWR